VILESRICSSFTNSVSALHTALRTAACRTDIENLIEKPNKKEDSGGDTKSIYAAAFCLASGGQVVKPGN
jgi:hypothetical protein